MSVNGGSPLEELMEDGKMSLREACRILDSIKKPNGIGMHVRNGDGEVNAIYGKSPAQEALGSINDLSENALAEASVDLSAFGTAAVHINNMGCAKRIEPEEGPTLIDIAKRNSGELDDIADALSQKSEFLKDIEKDMAWAMTGPSPIRAEDVLLGPLANANYRRRDAPEKWERIV